MFLNVPHGIAPGSKAKHPHPGHNLFQTDWKGLHYIIYIYYSLITISSFLPTNTTFWYFFAVYGSGTCHHPLSNAPMLQARFGLHLWKQVLLQEVAAAGNRVQPTGRCFMEPWMFYESLPFHGKWSTNLANPPETFLLLDHRRSSSVLYERWNRDIPTEQMKHVRAKPCAKWHVPLIFYLSSWWTENTGYIIWCYT